MVAVSSHYNLYMFYGANYILIIPVVANLTYAAMVVIILYRNIDLYNSYRVIENEIF